MTETGVITLNAKHRIVSDGALQWVVERKGEKGAKWNAIAYLRSRAGLLSWVEEHLCRRWTEDNVADAPVPLGRNGLPQPAKLIIGTPMRKNGKRMMDLQPGALTAIRALPEFHP